MYYNVTLAALGMNYWIELLQIKYTSDEATKYDLYNEYNVINKYLSCTEKVFVLFF